MLKAIARVLAIGTTCLMLYGIPAYAQNVNPNIHWNSRTWSQYCRTDGYGHFWGRNRANDRACWNHRTLAPHYHKDRWGRW
jgi:hypothetical protein